MLEPIRNGQNVALIQEFADQQLFRCGIPDPAVDVLGEFEWRNIAVSMDFKRFESDRGAIGRGIEILLSQSCRFCQCAGHLVQMWPDVFKRLNGHSRKWRGWLLQILSCLLENGRNVVDPCQNLARLRLVVGSPDR